MQTISAGELKRRGLAALDGLLGRGPVQVLQRNRPACVVLSPAEFARLDAAARGAMADPTGADVWNLLLADPDPPGGGSDRATLDATLREDRDGWDAR